MSISLSVFFVSLLGRMRVGAVSPSAAAMAAKANPEKAWSRITLEQWGQDCVLTCTNSVVLRLLINEPTPGYSGIPY